MSLSLKIAIRYLFSKKSLVRQYYIYGIYMRCRRNYHGIDLHIVGL